MKNNIRAFFYDYKYYLLPDGCEGAKALPVNTPLSVRRLREELCLAPDFTEDGIADETLVIEDIERAADISVKLYTREEYDALLRPAVRRVCPGCARYTDDGTDTLDGHHREISLSGCCYEREKEDEGASLAECMCYFWSELGDHADEIERCIDKDDQKKLQAIFNRSLTKFFTEIDVIGKKKNGAYHIYFPVMGFRPLTVSIIGSLAHFPEKFECAIKHRGWVFHSYLPGGVTQVKARLLKEKKRKFAIRESEDRIGFDISLEEPKKGKLTDEQQGALLDELHATLCARLGEDCVMYLANAYIIEEACENGVGFDEICQTMAQAFEPIKTAIADEDGELPMPMPLPYGRSADATEQSAESADGQTDGSSELLPFMEYVTDGATTLPDLTFTSRAEIESGKLPDWVGAGVTYAYLHIPKPAQGTTEDKCRTVTWYLSHGELVPAPVRQESEAFSFGRGIGSCDLGEHGHLIESLVLDEKSLYRMLRSFAPILMELGASLVTVNDRGILTCKCGFEMNPKKP